MIDPQLQLARARAAAARERLIATAQELQYRVKPSTLAGEASTAIKRKSGEIAEEAAYAVKKRPVAISATVAGVGALLGAGLFARWRRKSDTETT